VGSAECFERTTRPHLEAAFASFGAPLSPKLDHTVGLAAT
jgi:hypothetical protein